MTSAKKDTAPDAVLEYLKSQNRPYSVNDIVQNLHKEHGKAAVQKALEKLVQEDKVREKTYGKQKVYLVNQALLGQASPEELQHMDKLIEDKEKRVKELEAKLKEAQAELREINSSMTTEEAQTLLAKLTKENAELEAKREKLSADNVEVLDKEERDKIRSDRSKALGQWRQRRKMCMDMVNTILDGWPGTKDELFESAGIETDEDVGIRMPTT